MDSIQTNKAIFMSDRQSTGSNSLVKCKREACTRKFVKQHSRQLYHNIECSKLAARERIEMQKRESEEREKAKRDARAKKAEERAKAKQVTGLAVESNSKDSFKEFLTSKRRSVHHNEANDSTLLDRLEHLALIRSVDGAPISWREMSRRSGFQGETAIGTMVSRLRADPYTNFEPRTLEKIAIAMGVRHEWLFRGELPVEESSDTPAKGDTSLAGDETAVSPEKVKQILVAFLDNPSHEYVVIEQFALVDRTLMSMVLEELVSITLTPKGRETIVKERKERAAELRKQADLLDPPVTAE
jgi:hypothetical protein